jgi:hypothetical protein
VTRAVSFFLLVYHLTQSARNPKTRRINRIPINGSARNPKTRRINRIPING